MKRKGHNYPLLFIQSVEGFFFVITSARLLNTSTMVVTLLYCHFMLPRLKQMAIKRDKRGNIHD